MIQAPNVRDRQHEMPVMRHRKTSQFIFIKSCAEAEGWGIAYLDRGVGHDSHILIHKKRREVLEVHYRSARPVKAVWNGDEVPVHKIVDILTGVDLPKQRVNRA